MFIDMHCHILPGLDDGPDSFNEACELISQAYSSGTTIMTATPHYNNSLFKSRVNCKNHVVEVYKKLKEVLSKQNIGMSLFLGSELLSDDNIGELYKRDELIPINGTRYILTEFLFDESIANMHRYVDELMSYGLVPIVAHPERYDFLNGSHDEIYRLLKKGCKLQVNKESALGKNGKAAYNTVLWLLKNDFVHIIAGDCHSVGHRNADMMEIYEWMLDMFPTQIIKKWTHDNPKRILLDLDV